MNMYNNSNNGQNRRNNNQRRNNSRSNGSGKSNRNNQGRTRNYDDENISPQQKRHFINKRDTHLNRAKELRAAGDRVEAENEFQHAEHYTRMIRIADEQQQKYMDKKAAERQHHGDNSTDSADSGTSEIEENGEMPSNDSDVQSSSESTDEETPSGESAESGKRNQRRRKPSPNNAEPEAKAEGAKDDAGDIAGLSFMQPVDID